MQYKINRNISELGPWIEPNDTLLDKTTRPQNNYNFPPLTHRTLKLPRITPIEESKKLEVKLSKQSLELISDKSVSRYRQSAMNGSVLHFYGPPKDKKTRYQSISMDRTPRPLSRKVSTLRMGDSQPSVEAGVARRPGHFFDGEAAKKRSLKWVLQEMKSRHNVVDRYILDSLGR